MGEERGGDEFLPVSLFFEPRRTKRPRAALGWWLFS